MARYLVIREYDGVVVNAVEWDGDSSNWSPPSGHFVEHNTEVGPGWKKNSDGTFIPAVPTIPDRKKQMEADVDRKYQASLERGFTYDGATFSATGPKRARIVEMVTGQNAGKGLPRGKTSKKFRDIEGNIHDLNPTQLIDLAAAGSDYVEAVDDNYEALLEQIVDATTHVELDAIDTTTGWPG